MASRRQSTVVGTPCSQCGHPIHRSHARGFVEKLIRVATGYRVYRCHRCGWRGWIYRRKIRDARRLLRTSIALLLVLAMVLAIAYYVVNRVANAPPPSLFPSE